MPHMYGLGNVKRIELTVPDMVCELCRRDGSGLINHLKSSGDCPIHDQDHCRWCCGQQGWGYRNVDNSPQRPSGRSGNRVTMAWKQGGWKMTERPRAGV